MNSLSPMILLWISWGTITVILVGLVIYRAVMGIHEEDRMFLNRAEAALEQEQAVTLRRIHHLDGYIKGVGTVSGVLLLTIAGIWLYQGLYGQMP